jgi:hypothetical protein
MKLRNPLFVALAISLALHLLVVTGPAWELPTLDELLNADEGLPLDAHLIAPPGPPAVKPKRAKPKPRPPAPTEEKVSRGDTPPVAEAPALPPSEPADEEDDEPTLPAAALPEVKMTLPGFVRIVYRVTMGEAAFPIGRTVQEIRHDGVRYSMRNDAETTGIVRLFRPARMVNVSAGEVVASGLRPMEFWNRRDNGKGDAGHFDWAAGLARLDNGRQYPLEAGTQDMLSMFGQLAMMDLGGSSLSMQVATGKKVERYEFAVLGEERIDTPRGERPALHLRNRSPNDKESTEIWLGLDDGRLPIKIRHIDRRGDIFDQVAERIEFEETEGTR